MNRPRLIKNSQYLHQITQVGYNEWINLVPELGAFVIYEGTLYLGDGDQFNPISEVDLRSLGLGWAVYYDTTYSPSNSYNFTTAEFTIPNDAGIIEKSSDTDYYKNGKISPELNKDVYIITVAFKAYLNTSNGHAEIHLQGTGETPYERVADIITFPKGNGVEHTYSKMLQFYVDQDAVDNGLEIKFKASHSGSLYDIVFFIQKTFEA